MAAFRSSTIVDQPMLPTRSKGARRESPSPATTTSPPARRSWLDQKLAALGLTQPAIAARPLRFQRADLVHGGRAVTLLRNSTAPLYSRDAQ